MTQTAMLAGTTQRTNIFNILFRSQKPVAERNIIKLLVPPSTKGDFLLQWFKKSEVFKSVEFKSIPAGEIFQTDLLIIEFRLSDLYRDSFVLLRGLLEFSRPIKIAVSSNNSEKTFQLHASEGQGEIIAAYLDTIQRLFLQEIKFKKSLKAVLSFERAVKREQAKLYEELSASIR